MRSGRALALAALAALTVRCTTNDPTTTSRPATTRGALTWSQTAATGSPHGGHTATLLGDGRVLIAGGSGAEDSAEVFDPRTASFTLIASKMTEKRVHHTATMLFSGKVLLVGGGDTAVKSAEIFDPLTNTFTPTGSMSTARTGHAAVRLTTGRVLVSGGVGDNDTSVEVYDPASGTFSPSPARATTKGNGDFVLLSDSRAMFLSLGGAEAFDLGTTSWAPIANLTGTGYPRCVTRVSNGGVFATSTSFPLGFVGPTSYQLYDPVSDAFGPSSAAIAGASPAMSGVFMPNGRLLLVGAPDSQHTSDTALVWDPTSDTFTPDDEMPNSHYGQTATMLGNGDVLVVGGATPTANDLRPWPSGVLPADANVPLVEPRTGHVSVRLHDGRVLLAGGEVRAPTAPFQIKTSAEIFDPVARTSTPTGSMNVPRYRAAAIVLETGDVLVCGGDDPTGMSGPATATADVYHPADGTFHAVTPMSVGRTRHALTRLPDGTVLVTGGCKFPPCSAGPSCLCPIELFDPAKETFTTVGTALFDHAVESTVGEGAALLPNGLVLIAGGTNAELYDWKTKTLRAASPPNAQRAGNTLRILPSGKAFLSGGKSTANDIYDVTIEDSGANPWTGTLHSLPFATAVSEWAPTPLGDLVMIGGAKIIDEGSGAEDRVLRFDPVATNATPAVTYDAGGFAGGREFASWSLVGARLFVAGGDGSSGGTPVLGPVHADGYLYSDGAFDGARPVVDSAPAKARGGETITILGSRFTSRSAETPLAYWTPDTGAIVLPVTVAAFTATSISAIVPATAYYGHGWIHVVTGGIASLSVPLEIAPAEPGAACRFDVECASTFCADGFCCDQACSDPCKACAARRKSNAMDNGVCGDVTPGADPDNKCFSQQGATCTKDSMCASGLHCVSGVCCDSPCAGTCQSCTLQGKVGTCTIDPNCQQTCDGDHTLVPNGQPPTDCSPFKCSASTCLKTCASVNDCVGGAVCTFDGICAAPPIVSGSSETFLGCGVSRARGGSAFAIFFLSLLALARRRRR